MTLLDVQSSQTLTAPQDVSRVLRLDAWLESMRGDVGYGGPVAHWWQSNLLYTGAGLDWRYEGIIAGYLHLWRFSGERTWLEKACRAGDDLVKAQLPDSHFPASSFELNPASAGSPHEAACDLALLLLAEEIKQVGDLDFVRYHDCAARNLHTFYLGHLWDEEQRCFQDGTLWNGIVPNKAAIICEALFKLAELDGDESLIERYILPALESVLAFQVRSGPMEGAFAQNTLAGKRIEKYFPLYISRCIPALIKAYQWTRATIYLDGAWSAADFISRWILPDGSLPTVIYPNGKVNRWPSWVAPLADILRGVNLLKPYGYDGDFHAVRERMLSGQDASGGFQTASGFSAQAGGKPGLLPDVRDVLHVVGWCDKVFRYLAEDLELRGGNSDSSNPANNDSQTFETECRIAGKPVFFVETSVDLSILDGNRLVYQWVKGEDWARTSSPAFWRR